MWRTSSISLTQISHEEADSWDSGAGSPTSGPEVTKVVKKLFGGKPPRRVESSSRLRMSWDCLAGHNLCNIAWTTGAGSRDWQSHFLRRGARGRVPTTRAATEPPSDMGGGWNLPRLHFVIDSVCDLDGQNFLAQPKH